MGELIDGANPAARPRETVDRIEKVFAESVRASTGETNLRYEQRLDKVASVDSIAVVEFIAAVEKEFGIAIEPELLDFDFLRDLPRLASYLEERMGRRSINGQVGRSD